MLAERADELGIGSRELAARANVDRQRVVDGLENDIDLEAVLTVGEVKRILQALNLDLLTVFRIPCAFCKRGDQQFAELRSLPRNAVIARRREQLGLSQEDLLVKLKITDWFEKNFDRPWAQKRMALWRAIEEGPDSLDDLSLDQVRLLNRVLLLPVQLLLGVPCGTCGG
jgi:hypothetical protein